MCRHAAATSPFYQRRFAEAGIDPGGVNRIEDLAGLPLLTKNDVREHLPEILSSAYRREDLVEARTGGSTGVALQIYCDARGVEVRNAAALRSDRWSGWRLGQPIAAVWGNPPRAVTLKNRIRGLLKDRVIYLDTMRVDDAVIDQFLAEWKTLRPGMLYGHAHSLFLLCESLRKRGLTLAPTGIVATSMMLIAQEREVIEAVCGTKVTNRYGCEEVSLIACECEQHRGMHLNAESNIVEFLRDDGTPCAPGEDGRIVVTELVNRGMPMLRYEVGDRGVPGDRTCPCGRGLPLMEHVTGRVADFLVATDGHRVAGISIIENTLTKLPGIRQMQVIQEAARLLQVNLVPGPGYGPGTVADLSRALQGYLGDTVVVQLSEVATIPQEKSGKYRFTICRI
jgi:phenylacetate-CoA ligase